MTVRLSTRLFLTGNGFDFLQAVAVGSLGEAVVLMMYMIFSAMILLNGLISIVRIHC